MVDIPIMTIQKPKNGELPAYPPMRPLESWGDDQSGLTKREMFAAAALQGILANPESWQMPEQISAMHARLTADALLRELHENPQ
jgi:hypothetical protein